MSKTYSRRLPRVVGLLCAALLTPTLLGGVNAAEAAPAAEPPAAAIVGDPPGSVGAVTEQPTPAVTPGGVRPACGPVPAGYARCLADRYVTAPAQSAPVQGYSPVDIQRAYGLPARTSSAGTVAIVIAYGYPYIERDLTRYRATFRLPPCTTANGCLHIVNQRGDSKPLPKPQVSWGEETALDVDAASAACPSCKLVVVVADTSSDEDFTVAERTAVDQGATAVSNSWAAFESEDRIEAAAAAFTHPGVAFFAAAGDSGYGGAFFPADLKTVVAVGGTTLNRDASARGFAEIAWSGAGSGCSGYVTKPAGQPRTSCGNKRATSDVSAVADPTTGLAVYDSYLGSESGWIVAGGTSLASPLMAGIEAAGATPRTITPAWVYAHKSKFVDVVGGANGDCDNQSICTAVVGYDGPTGLGRPKGVSSFQ